MRLFSFYRLLRPQRLRFRLIEQLIGFFVLIVLIPLLVLSVSIYNINQNAVRKQVKHFSEYTVDAAYQQLKLEMTWQIRATENAVREWEEEAFISKYYRDQAIKAFLKLDPEIESIRYQDTNGSIIQQWGVQTALPIAVKSAKELKKISVQLLQNKADKTYVLHYWVRAQDARHTWHIVRKFSFLKTLIDDNQRHFHQSFALINPAGEIIAGTDDFLNETLPKTLFIDYKRLKAGEQLDIDKQSKANSTDNDDNDTRFGAEKSHKILIKMATPDWGIILQSPYSVQKEYIRKAQTQSILLVFACIILIIILGIWYSQNIYRNFRQLIKGIQALAEGNYARQIRLISRTFTPYEIVYLTGEFNRMAVKISEANTKLSEANFKLSKLDEMKSNLIDTVSHELRTPLTSIKGYTARLIRNYDSIPKEEQIKSLKVVKNQADRLGRLVEDLLVIPDIEKNSGLRVFPDCVNLSTMLEQAVHVIQEKSEKKIDISLPEEHVLILADPDRMEQVVLNIIDNAVKYADPDRTEGIHIHVETQDSEARIDVWNPCDTISEEALTTLFEKFKRLDERLTRTTRGTGLGLFITRGLVQAMGGKIHLDSDNGFTVSITMPLFQNMAVSSEATELVL